MALSLIKTNSIAASAVTSAKIADGAITNADINNTAAIAQAKLAAIAADALSGNVIDGGTISNFASTGIDDNADALAVTIDSSEKAYFEKTLSVYGNVDVYKNSSTKVGTIGAADNIGSYPAVNDFVIKNEASSDFHISVQSGNTPNLTITNAGNVGIFDLTPAEKFSVVGNTDLAGNLYIGTGTRATGGILRISNSAAFNMRNAANTADILLIGSNMYVNGNYIESGSNASGAFSGYKWFIDSITPRLYLDVTKLTTPGNVGIGTTAPSGKLDIFSAGASTTPLRVSNSGGSNIDFQVAMQGDNRPWMQIYQSGTEKIRFDPGSDSFITANLGIGTTSPGKQFHITKSAVADITTLSDGATITPDFNAAQNFTVTLAGNRTLANPSNITAGQTGSVFVVQDGTGSRTLSFGTYWDFIGGTAPTMTTTASAVDRIDYIVRTTTSIEAVVTLAYS